MKWCVQFESRKLNYDMCATILKIHELGITYAFIPQMILKNIDCAI